VELGDTHTPLHVLDAIQYAAEQLDFLACGFAHAIVYWFCPSQASITKGNIPITTAPASAATWKQNWGDQGDSCGDRNFDELVDGVDETALLGQWLQSQYA
jgi:hypothetical protein